MSLLVEDKTFEKKLFAKTGLPLGEYNNCVFIECDFSNANLAGQNFVECRFVDCNLSSADISNAAFKRVDFKSSKLLGLHFDYCNQFLFAVSFVECNLNMASFYRLKLKSTLFDSCSLKEVDFTAADLTQAKFLNSDLADAKFDQTNLQKADLSSAYNYIINPETNRIKKAVFSSSGIAGLLAHYDIVISN